MRSRSAEASSAWRPDFIIAAYRPRRPSIRQLQDGDVSLFRWPGTADDPLLVELARDRPVFERTKPERRMPGRRHARRDIGRLLAVEQHDVARQAEIAAWPIHSNDRGRVSILFRGRGWPEVELGERARQGRAIDVGGGRPGRGAHGV